MNPLLASRQCQGCACWIPEANNEFGNAGNCHANPPTGAIGQWPLTGSTDGCVHGYVNLADLLATLKAMEGGDSAMPTASQTEPVKVGDPAPTDKPPADAAKI